MLEICDREDAPEALKQAVKRWYDMGRLRMEAIAEAIDERDT